MAEEKSQIKWEGKSIAELRGPTADQSMVSLGGLLQYKQMVSKHRFMMRARFVGSKERLLMISPAEKCLSYEVLENNSGFKSYIATMKVLEINGSDAGENGCKIEWSFIADPVEGWTFEDFNSFINFCLQSMGKEHGTGCPVGLSLISMAVLSLDLISAVLVDWLLACGTWFTGKKPLSEDCRCWLEFSSNISRLNQSSFTHLIRAKFL
ncbi:hypothetical protein OIU78_002052 [Salix suchowensis]|nr:hypothetical protein OIU78_002052 [Salix suchowensis]